MKGFAAILMVMSLFLGIANVANAQARGENISSFTLENLQGFEGKKLSVYFVSGREAGLGAQGQELIVRKVFSGPLTVEVNGSGRAIVPSVFVPAEGWFTFNYAVFVVHNQPQHFIFNTDGSEIKYLSGLGPVQDSTLNRQSLLKVFVSAQELKRSPTIQVNRLRFAR
jgi:hypothetical protein